LREGGIAERILGAARASRSEVALVAFLGLAIVGSAALVWARTSDPPAPPVRRLVAAPSPSPAAPKTVVVHVAGQVVTPGVYVLPEGSRVKDAVAAAGGPVQGADVNALNLAAVIADGQKITVPKPGESLAPGAGVDAGVDQPPGKVSLNTATQAQLEQLPSIGPVLAQRIIAYRQTKGPFRSVTQLMDVDGFGPKKYESLKALITV
jgi:competence protein ComEA